MISSVICSIINWSEPNTANAINKKIPAPIMMSCDRLLNTMVTIVSSPVATYNAPE